MTRLCFIGDSLTNGTGDDEALGWPGRIVAKARAQGHDVTLYNLGIRRDTSADIASRWRAEVERRLPPMYRAEGRLAFCFGTNDCADDGNGGPRILFERAVANTEAILREAMAFAPTLMIGALPAQDQATDRRARDLSLAHQQICGRLGVPFLAAFDFVAGCDAWRHDAVDGDGVHPNSNGYAALADFIWQWPALQSWLTGS